MQKVTSFQGRRYSVIGEWIGIGFWCPGPESNRHGREAEGFSCHFGFRRRLAPFVAWSTPSP